MFRDTQAFSLLILFLSAIHLAIALPTTANEPSRTIQARDASSNNNNNNNVVDNVFAAAAMGNAKSKGFGGGVNKDNQCDLSKASIPTISNSPSALPSPSGTLSFVAIGRGTQNYTCDPAHPTATPAAVGAVANLYDASCVAGKIPFLLTLMPSIALQFPTPGTATDQLVSMSLLGHHYFTDSSTPVFNLDTAAGNGGYVNAKSAAKVPAPSGAPVGQNGQGFGAVPWLSLAPKEGAQSALGQTTFKSVYRVNTAGGNPPATCQGAASTFQVQYAAEYWFYT